MEQLPTTRKITTEKIVLYILSCLLGLVFLVSAFAKTVPISVFIDNISGRFWIQYQWASILARFIIGLEAGLGILLIMHLYGKWRWVLYVVLALLLAFTAFIIGIWIVEGNEADCGCMGEMMQMNPFWSIVKNIVLILITLILLVRDKKETTKSKNYFAWVVPILFLCYPFIFVPGELDVASMYPQEQNDTLTAPPVNLMEGKHVVAFMSLTCGHCKKAASNFARIYAEDSTLPILLVFPGNPDDQSERLQAFMEETGADMLPRHFIPMSVFRDLAGKGVPSIYLLNGTEIEDKIDDYNNMTTKRFQTWLAKG